MAITISLDTKTPYIGRVCMVSISGFSTENAYTMVEWNCNGLSGVLTSKLGFAWDGTRIVSSLSWFVPTSIYSKIPNSRSINVTLTATVTYSDGTATQTSSKNITVYCNESDCKPILDPTFSRSSGDKTSRITANSNLVIGGVTKLDISTNAQAVNGASISRQYISIPNGEETDLTNGAITNFGVKQLAMSIVVVDSRGFVSSYSKWFSPYAQYEPPTISLNVEYMNTNGDIPITIKGSYWNFPDYYKDYGSTSGSVQDCNKPSIFISCVSSGSSVNYAQIMEYGESYNQSTYSLSNVGYSVLSNENGLYTFEMTATITGLDYTETYDIQARVRDYIGWWDIDFLGSENIDSPICRSFSTPIFDYGKDDFNFNVPVYIKGEQVIPGGSSGTGTVPTIKAASGSNIGSVGTPSVIANTSGNETTFTFNYLKGASGATGATGNGISSITGPTTSGLKDTYKINYTNGTSKTFTVTNGKDGTSGDDYIVSRYSITHNENVWNTTAWSSGFIEFRLLKDFSNINVTTAWGQGYRGTISGSNVAYPIELDSLSSCIVTLESAGSNAGWLTTWNKSTDEKSITPSYQLCRFTTASGVSVRLNYYICGYV